MRTITILITLALLASCTSRKLSNAFDELTLSCGSEVKKGFEYVKIQDYQGDGRAYVIKLTDSNSVDLNSSPTSLNITPKGCVEIPGTLDHDRHIVVYDKNRGFNGPIKLAQSQNSITLDENELKLEIVCNEKLYVNKREIVLPIKLVGNPKHFAVKLNPQLNSQLTPDGLQLTLDQREQEIELKYNITNLQSKELSSGQCQIVLDQTAPVLSFKNLDIERSESETPVSQVITKPGQTLEFSLYDQNVASIYFCQKPKNQTCVYQPVIGQAVSLPESGEWEISAFAMDRAHNMSSKISIPIRIVNSDAIDSIIALAQTAKLQILAMDEFLAIQSLKKAYSKYQSLNEDYERERVEGVLYSAFWELGSKVQLQRVLEHDTRTNAIDVGPRFIVTASHDNKIFVWSKENPDQLASIELSDAAYSIKLNRREDQIAVSQFNSDLKIFDLATLDEVMSCPGSMATIFEFENSQIVYKPVFEDRVIVCNSTDRLVTADFNLENKIVGVVPVKNQVYIATDNGQIVKGKKNSPQNELKDVLKLERLFNIFLHDNKVLTHNSDGLLLLDPAQGDRIVAEHHEPFILNVATNGNSVALNSGTEVNILGKSLEFEQILFLEHGRPFWLNFQEKKLISVHSSGLEVYDTDSLDADGSRQVFSRIISNPIGQVLYSDHQLFVQERNSSEIHIFAMSAPFVTNNGGFRQIHDRVHISDKLLIMIDQKVIEPENRGELIDFHLDESSGLLAVLSKMDYGNDDGEWIFGTGVQLYNLKSRKLMRDLNIGISGAQFIRLIDKQMYLFGFEGIQVLADDFPTSFGSNDTFQIRQINFDQSKGRISTSDRNGLVTVYDTDFKSLERYQFPSHAEVLDFILDDKILAGVSGGQVSVFNIGAKEPFFEVAAHRNSSLLKLDDQLVFLGDNNRVNFLETSNWKSQKTSFRLDGFRKAKSIHNKIVSHNNEKILVFGRDQVYFESLAESYFISDDKIVISTAENDISLSFDFDQMLSQLCKFTYSENVAPCH